PGDPGFPPWLWDRPPHRADERRSAGGQLRHALSGSAQARAGRLYRVGMGRLGEQPQGQVLHAHARGPETARKAGAGVGADDGDHRAVLRFRRGTLMRAMRATLVRLASIFDRDRLDRELAAELESHLAMHIDDNLRSGMTAAEARRQALLKLGGVTQVTQRYRERRGLPLLENLARDLRFAARMLY